MTRICNFPISKSKRCKQPIADDKPNCGRHHCEVSADQLGQEPTVYQKDDELHVWASEPDSPYCLIHNDTAYQVLYQVAGETPPCCLQKDMKWRDKRGQYHRDDGPAIIEVDGTQHWYQHGEIHRDDGPARVELNGSQKWLYRGQLHRDDGPAVISPDGYQAWYQNGECHRDDGPAVIKSDGTRWWYQHDKRHRDDGPAIMRADGAQLWFWHGDLHREDGPAIIEADGTQYWWWYSGQVTEEEHAKLREQSRGA